MFVHESGAGASTASGSSAHHPAGLADALAGVTAALDALAAVDLHGCGDRELLDAVVVQQRLADRAMAIHLRTLGEVDRRGCYGLDGAVTLASWYRNRTRVDPAEASRRVHAATRLPRLPQLAAALANGDITTAHVAAVTEAAVPTRAAAIAEHEATLVELARHAQPRDLRTVLRAIADHVDADGSDTQPLSGCGPDPRRTLTVHPTIDGLHEIRGLLDQLDAEALLTALDAADTPDPVDAPPDQRRSPAQRRADALAAIVRAALHSDTLPSVQGHRPHVLLTADLHDLVPADLLARMDPATLADLLANLDPANPDTLTRLIDLLHTATADPIRQDRAGQNTGGQDIGGQDPAGQNTGGQDIGGTPEGVADVADGNGGGAPRLRWTGPLPAERARHLALHGTLTAILTLGPYRVVNVGRTHRTLPPWLRGALEARDRHCRGPDCDRPAVWAEAHHQHPWDDGGDTDLTTTIPLCTAHHDLVTSKRWHATLNPDTGQCTWTSRDGTTRTTGSPRRQERLLLGAT